MTMTKTPLPIPEEEDQSRIDLGPLRQEEGLSIYCQSCSLPLLGKGSGGGHDQGRWPWSYRAFFSLKSQCLLFWEREGVVSMIRGGGHGHTEPSSEKISSSSGKERGGSHGHTEPSSQKIASSSGKGKV